MDLPMLLASSTEEGGGTKILGNALKGKAHANFIFVLIVP